MCFIILTWCIFLSLYSAVVVIDYLSKLFAIFSFELHVIYNLKEATDLKKINKNKA